jgi:predicted transcriptional regulator
MTRTLEEMDTFNATLAKLLQRLKKKGIVTKVRQSYRGTGGQKHRRQIWIEIPFHPRGGPDLWLDGDRIKFGAIVSCSVPTILYGTKQPEEVYEAVENSLKMYAEVLKAAGGSSESLA